MSELVRRTDTDGVAVVELNRPDRKNAMTGPLMAALANTMEAIAADENVDAVVLCGAGGAFCSGLDLTDLITHRISIDNFEEGFAAMLSGEAGKVVMDWG